MKKKTTLAAILALVLMLSGCTILSQEQAALLLVTEPEEEQHIEYLSDVTDTDSSAVITDNGTEIVSSTPAAEAPAAETVAAEEPVIEEPVVEERDMTPLTKEYFDDAIFFGDSVSATLEYWDDNYGAVGKAITLCRNNYSLRTAVGPDENGNVIKLGYGNTSGGPQDIMKGLTNYNKAYIMLGMNDILAGTTDYVELWTKLVDNIHAARPDVKIVFQTLTPVVKANDGGKLNNQAIDDYNEQLRQFVSEHDCNLVDIGTAYKGEDGTLPKEYAKADGNHISIEGTKLWVEALMDPANYMRDPRA